MSRIGKLPVHLPAGVSVEVLPGNVVKVKGPLGELSQKVDVDITVAVEGTEVKLTRPTDQPRHRSLHGLYRALINNMVVGVSTGYTIRQELVGVGFRVDVQGQLLIMSLGYSHEIQLMLPAEVKAEAEPVKKGQNPVLCLKSADKQLIGVCIEIAIPTIVVFNFCWFGFNFDVCKTVITLSVYIGWYTDYIPV